MSEKNQDSQDQEHKKEDIPKQEVKNEKKEEISSDEGKEKDAKPVVEGKTSTEKALLLLKEKSLIVNGFLIAVAILFGYMWYSSNNSPDTTTDIGIEKAERKLLSFVEGNMVEPGTKVNVKGMSIENGLYKANLEIMGQEAITFISKDGSTFYPQGYVISEVDKQKAEAQQKADVEVPKTAKPKVEAFVMSYCPYGTQIQKGLLPVVEGLGDSIDFDFKFVDYAMHGEKEIEENVRQYCISENEPQKFKSYLSCFLKAGKSADCLASEAINTSLLTKCANQVDQEFKIDEKIENKETWKGKYPPFDLHSEDNEKYSVQGSPTLVVNGVTVQPARDSASLLTAICDSFETKPDACNEELSSDAPSPGFGSGSAPAAEGGSCN